LKGLKLRGVLRNLFRGGLYIFSFQEITLWGLKTPWKPYIFLIAPLPYCVSVDSSEHMEGVKRGGEG